MSKISKKSGKGQVKPPPDIQVDEREREDDILALAISRKICQDGQKESLSQDDIAEWLEAFTQTKQHQSRISKLIQRARKNGWLVSAIDWAAAGKQDSGYEQEVERRFFAHDALRASLKELSPYKDKFQLHILKGPDISCQAAETIARLLAPASTIGITFGDSLRKVVDLFGKSPHDGKRRVALPDWPEKRVIPVLGDPVYLRSENAVDRQVLSTNLAEDLARYMGCSKISTQFGMRGVPAYIAVNRYRPEGSITAERKREMALEFLAEAPGYKGIYGRKGCIHSMDTLITSVGVMHVENDKVDLRHSSTFQREMIAQSGEKPEVIHECVWGDIAGILIPKPNMSSEVESLVDHDAR